MKRKSREMYTDHLQALLIPHLTKHLRHVNGSWWVLEDGYWYCDRGHSRRFRLVLDQVKFLYNELPDQDWVDFLASLGNIRTMGAFLSSFWPLLSASGLPGPTEPPSEPPAPSPAPEPAP